MSGDESALATSATPLVSDNDASGRSRNDKALLLKTTAVSFVLIAVMASISFLSMNTSLTGVTIICVILFVMVGVLGVVLVWNPRALKDSADNLCRKYNQLPLNEDAYYVMFLRQFGIYIMFLLYALYLHPDLARHVWLAVSGGILVKAWHVQASERPIPVQFHVGEIFFLAFIGVSASLYSRQVEE